MNPLRVLITGTSRGLGKALAEHRLARGDRVIGCSRSASAIEHSDYEHLEVDLADESSIADVLNCIRKDFEGLDVLINNAGAAHMCPVALMPMDGVRRLFEINFFSAVSLVQGAIRLMRKSPNARIVNVSSVAVPLRLDGEAAYACAKAAIETFTRILAKEIGPMGVTCNAIGPTPIRTNLVRNVPEEKLDALIQQQAIRQWATPEDVSNVVDFFLQPASRMITGQVIYLGGLG